MSRLTEEVIRRKAEHHDGVLADLEEISLHQLELERIEVIGSLCRKLKILYLQNNIIPRIENLQHLKQLQYLNLALNNVTKIEGLGSCEFLNKLDLTVNFVDVDELEDSVDHLTSLLHLRELFLMGNPCMEWEGARPFIVASLPQLQHLDGKEITRTERIEAAQQMPVLRSQLRELANAKRASRGEAPVEYERSAADDADDENATAPWTPETRVQMAREAAERKAEQEARRKEREPPKRDFEKEHAEAVERVRKAEEEGRVRQLNEGRWQFSLDDEDGHGNMELRLQMSRYLDSSLINAEVHPFYVSVIIKGKTFRLTLSEEVKPTLSRCQRSQTTGELLVTMPKVRPNETIAAMRRAQKAKDGTDPAGAAGGSTGAAKGVAAGKGLGRGASAAVGGAGAAAPLKLGDELLAAAMAASGITGSAKDDDVDVASSASSAASSAASALAGPVKLSGLAGSSAPSKGVGAAQLPDGHGGTMLFRPSESRRFDGTAAGEAASASAMHADPAAGAQKAALSAAGTQPAAGGSSAGAPATADFDDDLPPLV